MPSVSKHAYERLRLDLTVEAMGMFRISEADIKLIEDGKPLDFNKAAKICADFADAILNELGYTIAKNPYGDEEE